MLSFALNATMARTSLGALLQIVVWSLKIENLLNRFLFQASPFSVPAMKKF